MPDLQATLELSVELAKLYNVDLFQRGYYQIRCALKSSPKYPTKVEVTLPHESEQPYVLPCCMVNGCATSKVFRILFRNEDITINDVFCYRIHMLIDSNKIEDSIDNAEFQLNIELWFGEEDAGHGIHEKLEMVSERSLSLHLSTTKGLHHHVPVLFDYFHLAAVEVTVHGSLIALHQPYIPALLAQRQGQTRIDETHTLESVYLSTVRPPNVSSVFYPVSRLHEAYRIHRKLCSTLLSAYESLQTTLRLYATKMPPCTELKKSLDCHARLDTIMNAIQLLTDDDDLMQTASTDVTQLCAENVILWTEFMDLVTRNHRVMMHLAREHHNLRVKRFSEAFYTFEYGKPDCLACFEPSIHGHTDIAASIRNSLYLQCLPPLPVECHELDGDAITLPIIFEDVYVNHQPAATGIDASLNESFNSAHSQNSSKNSRSDTSSNYSSGDQSPKSRPRMKKRFIKNIRPDTMKRPSTMSHPDFPERPSSKDVVLLGYRRTQPDDTRSIELGTFSPSDESKRTIAPATSMSTLLARSCWNRSSTGSLPDVHETIVKRDLPHPDSRPSSGPAVTTCKEDPPGAVCGDKSQAFRKGNLQDKRWMSVDSGIERNSKLSVLSSVVESDKTQSVCNDSLMTIDDTSICSSHHDSNDSIVIHDITLLESDKLSLNNEKDSDIPSNNAQTSDNTIHKQSQNDRSNNVTAWDGSNNTKERSNSTKDINKTEGSNNSKDINKTEDSNSTKDINITTQEGTNNAKDNDATNGSHSTKDPISDDVTVDFIKRHVGANNPDKFINGEILDVDSDSGSATSSPSDTSETIDDHLTVNELLKLEYARSVKKQKKKASKKEASIKNSFRAFSDSNLSAPMPAKTTRPSNLVRTDKPPHSTNSSMSVSASSPELSKFSQLKLVAPVANRTINFVTAKEHLKKSLKYNGVLYSELASTTPIPYFHVPAYIDDEQDGIHLVICHHGLDGNCADLRLVRTYMEMALPGYNVEFLMAERNQHDTFADFETMTDNLVAEITSYLSMYPATPTRVSFVGHSLGNLIIRSALTRPQLATLIPRLYTFLSLSGPHLGTVYNNSGLVNMGMWFMQKWKKSGSLLQLAIKDHADPRQSFIYSLSQKPSLELFKYVLLVSSSQDRYVPYHSTRIEVCRAAQRDSTLLGRVYCEMVDNILQPVINNPDTTLIRYDIHHALPNTANTIIGRAAHIAVLDSEIFLEKFLNVAVLKYFK